MQAQRPTVIPFPPPRVEEWPIRQNTKAVRSEQMPMELFGDRANTKIKAELLFKVEDKTLQERINLGTTNEVEKYEVSLHPPKSFNQNFVFISTIHPKWSIDGKHKNQESDLKKPSGNSKATLGGVPNLNGFQVSKAIAIAKSELSVPTEPKIDLLGRNTSGHRVGLCFGKGHWVEFSGGVGNEIQGEHAYPSEYIIGRLKLIDPKANRWIFEAHYYETTNILPMCGVCNAEKKGDYLKWIVLNKYYGIDFVNQTFPLNYDTVLPLTKTAQGLGDAMMIYFVNSHAAKEVLNPTNQLDAEKPNWEVLYLEEKEKTEKLELEIQELQQELAKLKLGTTAIKYDEEKISPM